MFQYRNKHKHIDDKLLSLLELVWHIVRALLWQVAKEERLSPIQLQILTYLATHRKIQRRVSDMALHYGLTLATISDAVSSLITKRLVVKKISEKDGRSYILGVTSKGGRVTQKISGWSSELKTGLGLHQTREKEAALLILMDAIRHLKEKGVIMDAKICMTCTNFVRDAHPKKKKLHHCNLTDTPLSISDLNIDCKTYAVLETADIWRKL